jgi:predicted enzyme related to lactoylglutathione lyase
MAGEFVWFHNGTEKTSESARFYEMLLGWKPAEGPSGMTLLAADAGPFAAILPEKGKGSGWVPYVQVEDVTAATERAVKLGAELLESETRGPAGTYSIVRDPGGATLALWQKA